MSDSQIAGIPYVAIDIVLIVLAVFWVFLPVIIWGQLKEIIKLLKELRDRGDDIDRNTRPPGREPDRESAAKYKIPGL